MNHLRIREIRAARSVALRPLGMAVVLGLALAASAPAMASIPDHQEFEASLNVPFNPAAGNRAGDESRSFLLEFEYKHLPSTQAVGWKLELLSPAGRVLQTWYGVEKMAKDAAQARAYWAGRSAGMADGIYQVRMTANALDAATAPAAGNLQQQAERILAMGGRDMTVQTWPMKVGKPAAPAMPVFKPLATRAAAKPALGRNGARTVSRLSATAAGSLPYTVYYGNLHSQTNHSDGGGDVSSCVGAQNPQSGAYGPTDAYQFAMNRGLDFLMTSEHNHMYDGSTGTNASADPATAKNLFQSGLSMASSFNASNPSFLAVYGLEWGVITNGGHLNIFNTNQLLEWEYNSSGQLIGDIFTAKSDYASLYTLMNQHSWVGQFNHPSASGQFNAGGVDLGYTADGDQVMALCEVLNTSAFSSNTTETETSRTTYEAACNKALEAGYHVAFTTDQDNHCANWGASYTNRTGILVPNGTALTQASMIDAMRARRVFATMDKNSQLILTANGHLMGERFSNGGALTLVANFSSSTGRSASAVAIYEGVPGRNGTVTQTSSTATTTITPALGDHFYYAKVTQDDGNILWSAPVWVTETNGGGTPPTVSAAETGTSGSITLSANATDSVGVTKVEFYVDNALVGSLASAPYSMTLDSTTLTNAGHTLVAKAYDAAGYVGTSTSVAFTVNNSGPDTTPPTVSAAESGSSGSITLSANATDNVGVTKVEFYVDNVLKGSLTSAPYSMTLDSTTLANASHTLLAKAYDAAGNVGTSSAVSFTVNNGGDTTPPTVSAAEAGSSGSITLSANATDNVGVTRVEFYVDNVLKGTTNVAPYRMSLDSTTLSNASHSLVAKAYDAANNVGVSSTVAFTVNNGVVVGSQLILNGGFESGAASWNASSGVISNDTSQPAHSGSYKAWLDGYGTTHTDTLTQQVTIPANANSVTLGFWLMVVSDETSTTTAYDKLKVQVLSSSGAVLGTLATYSNLDKGASYTNKVFDLSAYKGQTVQINFVGTEDARYATSFLIDDVSLNVQ